MGPFLLELLQEVFDQLVFMYKIGGAQKSMPVKVIRLIEMGYQVLGMDHTGQLIQALFKDGEAGVMQLFYPLA